uniref:Uncharacterized protein n=1 Tax=Arundo donax TaxID=35708 RepID=A0A0A9DUP7_ARUDO
MLFYVRDSVGNSMVRKDNSTANVPVQKTPEKIACLNGITQSGVKAPKLNGSSSLYGDKKMHNMSNAYSSIFGKSSPDRCSKNVVKIEGAAASQNSVLPSVQQDLGPRNDGATLPTKLVGFTVSVQETSSSHQPVLLINTSGKPDRPLLELQPKADTEKIISVSSSMVSGAATLSKSDKQASQPQTATFSNLAAHVDDTYTKLTAQTLPKKDAVVSSGVIPSSACLSSSEKVKDLLESLEQANENAKALPMSQNNIASGLPQVNCGKQICAGGSVQVIVADSCNGSIARKANMKSKKVVRYPVVNMWLGSRQLLVASLKLGKKTKHKRTRRRSVVCKDMTNIACLGNGITEQLTSTSATAPSEAVQCTSDRGKCASREDDTQSSKDRQKVVGACVGAGTSATFASADLPKLGPRSSADPIQSKKIVDAKLAVSQPVSIGATGLMEATVPCWDDIDVQSHIIQNARALVMS